jgi:RNA-binding protein
MTASDDASPRAPALTGAQRRFLRGRAHPLRPVVHVGASGMTDGVMGAVDRALLDHELIKVRLHQPDDKDALATEIAARTGAALAGVIGHTVILYRPHPEAPRLVLPRDAAAR